MFWAESWAELSAVLSFDSDNVQRLKVYWRNFMADKGINRHYHVFEWIKARTSDQSVEDAIILSYDPLERGGKMTYTLYYIDSKQLGTVDSTFIRDNVSGVAMPVMMEETVQKEDNSGCTALTAYAADGFRLPDYEQFHIDETIISWVNHSNGARGGTVYPAYRAELI